MEPVNSVHQYSATIKHCHNIIRTIVSIQEDAFDCRTRYRTLATSRWCNNFGSSLYLIDCRRVCYLCFILRAEYSPLTTREASKFFPPSNAKSPKNIKSSRKLLELVKPPSILSLPGRYCGGSPFTHIVGKRIGEADSILCAGQWSRISWAVVFPSRRNGRAHCVPWTGGEHIGVFRQVQARYQNQITPYSV